MPGPIDDLYFSWLRAKVVNYGTPSHLYDGLLKILYGTEFVFLLEGDKNRQEDGLELRLHFLRETGYDNDPQWYNSPCSVLEVFISFAHRAAFETDMPSSEWFWIFLRNLGLEDYRHISESDVPTIQNILEVFLFRIYNPDGSGGMFPLHEPTEDQTKLEIWFQFNRYLEDQGLV